MFGRVFACFLALTASPSIADIAGREFLGYGRIIVNDLLGDGRDRWRTGSASSSRIWGYGWDGRVPEKAFDLLEFRFGGEIISPRNINDSGSGDRPWAGALSWGLHTHFRSGETEFAMGADLIAIGPMTHLDDLQSAIHDAVGIPGPSDTVLAGQLPNQWTGRAVAEMGRDYGLGEKSVLRPFAEARLGDESLVRAGFDVTLGRYGEGELLVRDWVTGHRYRAVKNQIAGTSFVIGADIAKVFDSVYLPDDRGLQLTDTRQRARMGFHWRGKKSHVFYGVTWLSEEFVGQGEGQVVGAIRLDLKF
ncbi:lipid A-modifier LpxR family protein [Shimia abyssi]|uniref:Uncharacterized protein DUF2219 n=1 Tax=Shimia abyssi TaxID=1662395 RepID=A0A2P8F7J0_9RHOB|nr:lipid A-modifier LpxR family protein [Shimia abyssi]PSL17696.1 uncharacterized protein DUF2219 [Shimia abyssi]